jgi:uncharacterized membrane protein YidH (DUF202 family)
MRRGQLMDRALLALLVFGMAWEAIRAVVHAARSEWSQAGSRLLFTLVLLAVSIAAYRMLFRNERRPKTEN